MIAGHFAFAAAVKFRERQVPLWSLMLATVWLDIVFVPMLIGGMETIETAPGVEPGYGASIIHADYTHSLVGALVLSVAFGLLAAIPLGRRNGLILGAVSFSHWVLDLLFHRQDMPILPGDIGGMPRLGLGLWQYPMVAIGIELLLVLAGGLLYWRACREVAGPDRGTTLANLAGALVLFGGIGVLLLDATGVLG